MPRRPKRVPIAERATYDVEVEWTAADRRILKDLEEAEALLPKDAPRALLSVRLSVFKEDTTSPVRQELDMRRLARDKGYRVVGLASDLNVSATKVPPWKRKELGDWLANRVPEFDALLFWKVDRFIRNLGDLHAMIAWVRKYGKNLVSVNDAIDLETPLGQAMVGFIGAMAEVEGANTKLRVESLWAYTKTQDEWKVGKPPYGYMSERDETGKRVLVHEDDEYEALRVAYQMIVDEGCSVTTVAEHMRETSMMTPGLTTSTLLRRLRNPGLQGYRVEENKSTGARRSKLLYGDDGKPIRTGPPIFDEDEFEALQDALDQRSRNQPTRQPGGATKFLGVLTCADCGTNMTVQCTTKKGVEYRYLRCRTCKSGGLGVPNPDEVYAELAQQVLTIMGDLKVQHREYAQGEDVRKEIKQLEASISYYMTELAPGGRFDKNRFAREQATSMMDAQLATLDAIDPDTAEDRWVITTSDRTWREQWGDDIDAMATDLVNAGVTCQVTRTKVPGQRAPQVDLAVALPEFYGESLIQREDDFAVRF